MSRWTVCLAFLKAFFGLEPVHVSLSSAHTHTHASACPNQSGGACCWRVVGFGACGLSLCRRPKWGVCLALRARARTEASRQLLFFSSSSGGREGGEGEKGVGSHDILAKKKKDYRFSFMSWFF